MVKKIPRYVCSFWHDPWTWQTDGQTDRRKNRQTPHDSIDRACIKRLAASTRLSTTVSKLFESQLQKIAILKIVISPYLSEKASGFDEILYTAADFELDERHVINKKLSYRWQTAQCCFVKLLRYCRTFCQTRKVWLPDGKKKFQDMFVHFDMIHEHDRRTDRQKDGRTDRHHMTA